MYISLLKYFLNSYNKFKGKRQNFIIKLKKNNLNQNNYLYFCFIKNLFQK
jgi:hypothetical protein